MGGQCRASGPLSVMKPLMDMVRTQRRELCTGMGTILLFLAASISMCAALQVNHERGSSNRMRYDGEAFELVHEGDGIAAGEEVWHACTDPLL